MIYEDYLVLTPGPVKMSNDILKIGAKQIPYFRNNEFSKVLLNCEKLLLNMLNAPANSRVIFLTASGTAGLESVVMNMLNITNNALVVNGGGFGQRFVDICNNYDIKYNEIKIKNNNLSNIDDIISANGYDSFIVNAHETSVGHIYNLDAIGKFCKKNNLLNIVDAISMFVTDELDMQKQNIDTVILSSQKGLALPPGLTMLVLNQKSINRIYDIKSHYFNFKNYLKDGLRGQTPYTPCVSIILQLEERLKQIKNNGGIKSSIEKANNIAKYFRKQIKNLPFKEYTSYMPNAMTTLTPTNEMSANDIVNILETNYKIMVCPNGGELKDKIFRISHMGDINTKDIDILIDALKKIVGK